MARSLYLGNCSVHSLNSAHRPSVAFAFVELREASAALGTASSRVLLRHPQELQNFTLFIPNDRSSLTPIHHNRPDEQASILLNLSQRITLARRPLDQVPSLAIPDVFEDTLQLIRRGICLGYLEVERFIALVLCRVV